MLSCIFARCSSPFVPWLLQVKKSAKKLQPQGTEPARRPSQKEKRGVLRKANEPGLIPCCPPHGPPWSPQLREGPGVQSQLETAAVEVSGSQDPIRVCRSLPWATLSSGHQATSGAPVAVTLGTRT